MCANTIVSLTAGEEKHNTQTLEDALAGILVWRQMVASTKGITKCKRRAYYPEANVLVPLHYIDEESGTLSYKSVPIRVKLRSKEVRAIKIA